MVGYFPYYFESWSLQNDIKVALILTKFVDSSLLVKLLKEKLTNKQSCETKFAGEHTELY